MIRLNNYLCLLIGLCFLFIFVTSFSIYSTKYLNWYSLIDSAFSSANRILNNINKRIEDFGNVNHENRDEITKKVLQDIVKSRISKSSDDWRFIPFYSIVCATVLSALCLWIISGDALLEGIKWAADIFGVGNFEIIKELNIEKLIFYLITGFSFLSGFIFLYSSKQIKVKLIDSLDEIENRPLI